MIFAFALFLVLAALSIDVLWLPALLTAVAIMHWTTSLHLPDPLAPLYAFIASAVMGRFLLSLAIAILTHRRRSPFTS
jgi:hypothetical protein